MSYRIPHLKQPPKSVICVPVCAEMAIKSFGYDVDRENLIWAMNTSKTGTYYSSCAWVLASMGFEVIYQDQPHKMPARYVTGRASKEEFHRYVRRSPQLYSWDMMLDGGVNLVPSYATLNRIDKMIRRGYVALVATRPKILARSRRNGFNDGHSIIVKRVDFNKRRVHVIDPSPYSNAKKSYSFDHFEAARVGHDHVIFVRDKK